MEGFTYIRIYTEIQHHLTYLKGLVDSFLRYIEIWTVEFHERREERSENKAGGPSYVSF